MHFRHRQTDRQTDTDIEAEEVLVFGRPITPMKKRRLLMRFKQT